jgi:GDP-L-fucose synthase
MKRQSKIYVAGHRGLVGSAIWRNLEKKGYQGLVGRTHAELDLTDQAAVRAFFASERPEYVVLAAAKVGGIHANDTHPADFTTESGNSNTSCGRHDFGVKKQLFLGRPASTALAPQPIPEDALHTARWSRPTRRRGRERFPG